MHSPTPDTPTLLLSVTRLLLKSHKALLLGGAIGIAIGLLASQFIHPRWTAKMAIQLGQVSTPDAKGSLVTQLIENQLTATERYNLPSFRVHVLHELGLPAPDSGNKDADLLFDSLNATAGKSPNVINLQSSANSRETAIEALNTAFKELSAMHGRLFDQATSSLQGNLAAAQTRLITAQQSYTRVNEELTSTTSGISGRNSARDVLLSNTITLLSAQILDLQQKISAYQDALSPLRSYPTAAMGPAYAPTRSSTPSPAVFAATGAAFGLIAAATLALLSKSARTPRST